METNWPATAFVPYRLCRFLSLLRATMPNTSRPLHLEEYDAIDWDPVEAENSNLAKCMNRGIDEGVVWEVLEGDWVDVEMPVDTAEFVVVAPKEERNQMWTLLFAT